MCDDACGMKVGTDALILGSWAGEVSERKGQPPVRILDIGTGSGIIALMLAQRFPSSRIDAVEIEPDAANQARFNVASSEFSERIVVHQRAIQGWSEGVDLAVCNPPFFHNHPKSDDRKRNLARHDDTLPVKSLFSAVKACLHPEGELAMIFPEDRSIELREEASRQGFYCKAYIQLRATPNHEVIRSLWAWGLSPGSETKGVWNVEGQEGPGSWSDELAPRLLGFLPSISPSQQPKT